MPITAFLKIPDIDGESVAIGHEDEIDIHGIDWGVTRKSKGVRPGRPPSKALVSPLEVHKFYDAASPYITLAALQGKAFDEIVLSVRTESGDAPFDYLRITMTNCLLRSYTMFNDGQDDPLTLISERVAIVFEQINILYVTQGDDGTTGPQHEVEYNIAAGV